MNSSFYSRTVFIILFLLCGQSSFGNPAKKDKTLVPFGNVTADRWRCNAWGGGKMAVKVLKNQPGKFSEFLELNVEKAKGTLSNASLFKKINFSKQKQPVSDFYLWYRCRDFKGTVVRNSIYRDVSKKTYSYSYRLGLKKDGKWHLLMLGKGGWSRHRRPINMNEFIGINFVVSGTGKIEIGEWGKVYKYKIQKNSMRAPDKVLKAVHDNDCKIIIDGMVNKNEWGKAGVIQGLKVSQGKNKLENKTIVLCKSSNAGLYFAAKCFKNDMTKLKADYNSNSVTIWHDESVEFSIDPGRTTQKFEKITVNANGCFSGVSKLLDGAGIKVSSKKYNNRWETEIFIPWSFLKFKQQSPFVCGVNVTRNCYDGKKLERSGWTTTVWNAVDKFGAVIFDKNTANGINKGKDSIQLGKLAAGEYIIIGKNSFVPGNYRISIFTSQKKETKIEGQIKQNDNAVSFKLPANASGISHVSFLMCNYAGETYFLEANISETLYSKLKPLDVDAISLFPLPRIFKRGHGFIPINSKQSIYIANPKLAYCSEKIISELKDFYNLDLHVTDNINKARIVIGLNDDSKVKNLLVNNKLDSELKKIKYDGFILYASDNKIIISANENRGVLYSVNAFIDLIKMSSGDTGPARICKVTVVDWPRQKIRFNHTMMHSYFHRTKYDVDFFNKMLELFPISFRFNGFLFEFGDYYKWESVPLGTKNAWDKKDYAGVIDFINRNYIPVMPSIQSHGHMKWWLFRGNKLKQFREDGCNDVLCTRHPDTYKMLFDIYYESWKMCSRNPEYTPKYFFASMDEVRWKTSSTPLDKRCKYCKGIPKNILYLEHIKKLNSYINKKDAKMLMCSDMLTEGHNGLNEFKCSEVLERIPRNVIMCHWSELDFPSIAKFKKLGFENWKFLTAYKESAEFENKVAGYCFNNCSYNWWLSLNRSKPNSQYGIMAQALFINNCWNELPEDFGNAWRRMTFVYGNHLMRNWSRKPLIHAGKIFSVIELSDFTNRPLTGSDGWFALGKEFNLSQMNFKSSKVAGVPVKFTFKKGIPQGIVLQSQKTTATIDINRKAASLIMLHGSHLAEKRAKQFWNAKYYKDPLKGKKIVKCTVNYIDKTQSIFYIRYGWNISEWRIDSSSMGGVFSKYLADSRSLWEGKTLYAVNKNLENDIALYQYEWVNPYPDKKIKSISLKALEPWISYGLLTMSARDVKNDVNLREKL